MEILIKALVIIPLILWVVTAFLLRRSSHKLNNYYETTGTIVRMEERKKMFRASNDWRTEITPVIAYTINGTTYECDSDYFSSSMKPGKKIKIMYNCNDFSKATVKKGLYLGPAITGIMAVCFTAAYIIALVLLNK